MSELLKDDVMWCLRRLPRGVFTMLKERAGKLFLAGGFIRACIANEPASDVDLFAESKDSAEAAALLLAKDKKDVYKTDNAFTVTRGYGLPIQFIHRWVFTDPTKIIESFDFTVACSAIWCDSDGVWQSNCHEKFYPDLAAKRLRYLSPVRNEDAGGSMLRVLKFYQKGYRIPLDSYGAVVARLVMGIDQSKLPGFGDGEKAWAHLLGAKLLEVDPLLDLTHAAHLPSTSETELDPKEQ